MRFAGGIMTIDLAALKENYGALARVCAPAQTAGIAKADAYGLGIAQVVPALASAGCGKFFVALPDEGFAVRQAAPEADIYVLNGLFSAESAAGYPEARLIPVLNSQAEIQIWESFCGASGTRHPCAINVDTGMNRLGLTASEALTFADENSLTRALEPIMVMSHLACADDLKHPMNRLQLESFQQVVAAFGDIEASLVNSAGVLLGADFRFDLTRPGVAIYGGSPLPGVKNPMRTVVTAEARISQIRYARAGETVSYGATTTLGRDTIIAVAAAGYADGYHRAASATGVPLRALDIAAGHGIVAGRNLPILGRVTMDLTMFDVTDLGVGGVNRGEFIELFGPNIPIDVAAKAAGTISYELLTSLGRRFHRRYVGLES
ncbi:MAG: alanine racemase [Mesorhizobium sp.]|nr:alanine racemase [Mesorhizobium sp.]